MADLTGSLPSDTYKQLLQIGSGNVGVAVTLKDIQDGSGTNTALQLSTTTANINGTFTINGFTYSINAATTITGGGTISLGGFTASFTGNATLSGTNTGDQTITLTGDVTGSGTGSFATTYAGIVPMNKGGMNASITASAGGIFYSTGSAGALLSGTATANKILMSGSSGAPSWSTPTYPTTASTSGKIITSDGTNFVMSTPTYPSTAGTSGNIIKSDGTNFTSAAAPLAVTSVAYGTLLTGLSPSIVSGSKNLTSITRNGAGDYTVNFSITFGSTPATQLTPYANNSGPTAKVFVEAGIATTTSVRVFIYNTSGTLTDPDAGFHLLSIWSS